MPRTLLARSALTAPRFIDAGLGITAAVFAVALTWLTNKARRELGDLEETIDGSDSDRG